MNSYILSFKSQERGKWLWDYLTECHYQTHTRQSQPKIIRLIQCANRISGRMAKTGGGGNIFGKG